MYQDVYIQKWLIGGMILTPSQPNWGYFMRIEEIVFIAR